MTFGLKDWKEVKDLVFDYHTALTEKEFDTILDSIQTLLALIKSTDSILRHLLEKNPPLFAAIIQKFIIMNNVQNESLVEMLEWANGIVKEFWAMKYQNKEGGA